MSGRLMFHAWNHSTENGSHLLLEMAIADQANDNGYARCSIRSLAAKSRLSYGRARAALVDLVNRSRITVSTDQGHWSEYQLLDLPTPRENARTLDTTPPENARTTPPENARTPRAKTRALNLSLFLLDSSIDLEEEDKREILKTAGVYVRDIYGILEWARAVDILAEIARTTYAANRGRVRSPAAVICKNLINRQKPGSDWYEPDKIKAHLPDEIKALFSQDTDSDYTQDAYFEPEQPTQKNAPYNPDLPLHAVQAYLNCLGQLKLEMPGPSYDFHIEPLYLADYQNGDTNKFVIQTANPIEAQWIGERLGKTITRNLTGITGQPCTVEVIS